MIDITRDDLGYFVERSVRLDGRGSFFAIDEHKYRPENRKTVFRPGQRVMIFVHRTARGEYAQVVLAGDDQERWLFTDEHISARLP